MTPASSSHDPRIECGYCHTLVHPRHYTSHLAICEGLQFIRVQCQPSEEARQFEALVADAARREGRTP